MSQLTQQEEYRVQIHTKAFDANVHSENDETLESATINNLKSSNRSYKVSECHNGTVGKRDDDGEAYTMGLFTV